MDVALPRLERGAEGSEAIRINGVMGEVVETVRVRECIVKFFWGSGVVEPGSLRAREEPMAMEVAHEVEEGILFMVRHGGVEWEVGAEIADIAPAAVEGGASAVGDGVNAITVSEDKRRGWRSEGTEERAAVGGGRGPHACETEDGGADIHEGNEVGDDGAGGWCGAGAEFGWDADDEGDTKACLVQVELGAREAVTVIGVEDDDGIVVEAVFAELLEKSGGAKIGEGDVVI